MKTVFKFALMGLAASLFVLGCSKSDTTPEGADNPNGKENARAVTANFVFSVSTGSPETKMTSADVQGSTTETFRGIGNAALLTFKRSSDNKSLEHAAEASKVFSLGTILSRDEIKTDGTTSHRVLELSLPVETNTLVFYGKALQTTQNGSQGISVMPTAFNDLSAVKFAHKSRLADSDVNSFNDHKALFAYIINKIMGTKMEGYYIAFPPLTISGEQRYRFNATEYSALTAEQKASTSWTENVTLGWSQYAEIVNSLMVKKSWYPLDPTKATPMCPLGEILGQSYATYNHVWPGEIRPGSGSAIERLLQDLHTVIKKVAEAEPTSMAEAVARSMGRTISDVMERYVASDGKFLSVTQMKNNDSGLTTSLQDEETTLIKFPSNFNIPMGATQMVVEVDGSAENPTVNWSYASTLAVVGGTNGIDAKSESNYVYPTELYYFGNSPIRVTAETVAEAEYPQGVTNWDADASWTSKNWTVGHVLSSTRSVAMKYNINYGVALLHSTIKFDNVTTLYDNNKAIQARNTGAVEDDKEFTLSEIGNKLKVTGILVGGQPGEVNWHYIDTVGTPQKVVYDNSLVGGTPGDNSVVLPSSGTTDLGYTLVWDNYFWDKKGDKQPVTYVAIEFYNGLGDFYGHSNLIRNGGTFYIVGKLDPNDGLSATDLSDGITWPNAALYALPPYNADGSTIKERRVFIQDYMTVANFVIGEKSLQNAYIAVPDLRSTQISLGLSVDLQWRNGLTFNVPLGQ